MATLLGIQFSLFGSITMKAEEANRTENIAAINEEEQPLLMEMQTDVSPVPLDLPEMEAKEKFSEAEHVDINSAKDTEISVKGDSAFGFWQYRVNWDDEVTITKYTGAEANVSIPRTIEGKSVKYLGYNAFSDNTWIVSVNVPDTVISIEGGWSEGCFSGCTSLSVISGMANVTYIGSYAFYNCSNLTAVSFGTSLAEIDDHAFKNCVKLTNCTFPSSLTILDSWCFENTGLTSISILSSDVKLGSGVFYNCQNIASVQINSYVPNEAFNNCPKLTTVSVGANVGIGYQAFYGCSSLKNITIAEGSEGISIGENSFLDCTGLETISLPQNVRYINRSAFNGCTSLQNVRLPFGLLEIGNYAFYGNTALKSIVIPNSVIKIGYEAFGYGSLNSILIPNSVTAIGDNFCNNSAVIQCYPGSYAQSYATNKNYQTALLQPVASSSLSFSAATVYMNVDDVKKLSYAIAPANTTDAIIWESSSSRIATVNGVGEVTAEGSGSATIIATTTSGVRASVNVVVANKPNSISFKNSEVTIMVGESKTQAAVVKDNAGIRNDVIPVYSSSNSGIASVSAAGTVTGLKEGKVTITAKTSGLSASYKVMVVSNKPTGISFKKSKKTVIVGHTSKQKATVTGAAGILKNAKPTYTSSNKKIATVSSTGAVKGRKTGTVTIKAKIGKYTASYKVGVVMAKISKKGKTLKITTIPRAKVKVSAKKSVLGSSSKTKRANKKGVVKIKFRNKIKGVKVKVKISKSGYKKRTITKNF